jgi:hypothetical protein
MLPISHNPLITSRRHVGKKIISSLHRSQAWIKRKLTDCFIAATKSRPVEANSEEELLPDAFAEVEIDLDGIEVDFLLKR